MCISSSKTWWTTSTVRMSAHFNYFLFRYNYFDFFRYNYFDWIELITNWVLFFVDFLESLYIASLIAKHSVTRIQPSTIRFSSVMMVLVWLLFVTYLTVVDPVSCLLEVFILIFIQSCKGWLLLNVTQFFLVFFVQVPALQSWTSNLATVL